MGCDIHMRVERFDAKSGYWREVLPPLPTPSASRAITRPDGTVHHDVFADGTYYSACYGTGDSNYGVGNLKTLDGYDPADGAAKYNAKCVAERCVVCAGTGRRIQWYSDRNYRVFAMLTTTVRNEWDLEGVVRQPRGLPADLGPDLRRLLKSDEYALGDHSVGWLTLAEILAWFDERGAEESVKRGVIHLWARDNTAGWRPQSYEEWAKLPRNTQPAAWSGDVGGRDVVILDREDADAILANPNQPRDLTWKERGIDLSAFATGNGFIETVKHHRHAYRPGDGKSYYVRIAWRRMSTDDAAGFLEWLRRDIEPLASGGSAEDVRLVFGFDS